MPIEYKSEAAQNEKSVKMSICEPGKYPARVLDQYFGASKEKGTVSFNLAVTILANCNHPDAPHRQMQKELTWWITDETFKWVISDLQKLGYPGRTLEGVDPDTDGHHSFVDLELDVFCRHEEYKNEIVERWSIRPGRRNLADKTELRRLDQRHARQEKQQAKAANGSPQADESRDFITEEDVPF